MNTEQKTQEKRGRGRPKDAINKGGRPKKDKKGVYLWLPAEYVDAVQAYFELLKQQQNKQAKQ